MTKSALAETQNYLTEIKQQRDMLLRAAKFVEADCLGVRTDTSGCWPVGYESSADELRKAIDQCEGNP